VAVNLLDTVIKDHVAPVLKEAGFAKSGKTFRRTADNGDVAVIEFQRSAGSLDDRIIFFVNLAAVPVPQHDWLYHDAPAARARKPSSAAGLWRQRILAPDELNADRESPWRSERWLIDGPSSVDAVGSTLAHVLTTEAIPMLIKLLDRKLFLELALDPAKPLGTLWGDAPALLLVDAEPSGERDTAIAAAIARDPEGEFAAWLRERVAQRSGPSAV
jgi:hypothetical protein